MKIALIGASGFIGSAIRQEALARGHQVTALVSNPAKLQRADHLEIVATDALDSARLAAQLRGHDIVISAFSGHAQGDVYGYYLKGIGSIVAAARSAGMARLLVVGGAGSLEIAPGVQLLDTPAFPAQWRATAEGARAALHLLREMSDLDWTMLSPPPMIHPGSRSGHYRTGTDAVIAGANGPADISVEDYAVAMLDEAETPRHRRQRFTVAN
ncbi:MAG: NAD(P)-dependent oxidoreductase [Aquabacterium sp.]|nr:NAD(P)-dependent oxidoreductase [Aquabacterium sp.]